MTRRMTFLLVLLALVIGYVAPRPLAAYEKQPHMTAALGHLNAALESLQKAKPDKGGHREAAIAATKSAIDHTREGIEYAEKH